MSRTRSASMLSRLARPLTLLAAAAGAIAIAGSGAAAAQAAIISTSACDNAALTQPFAAWGDSGDYKLIPGGDFNGSLSGWSLTGGAHVVSGGPSGSSLLLPAGASVTTPATCVNAAYPTFRFFARDATVLSTVAVSVVYTNTLGLTVTAPVGVVALSGSWQPTLRMLTASAVTGALDGGTAQVSLRFTALLGSSQIDDIYVDPRIC